MRGSLASETICRGCALPIDAGARACPSCGTLVATRSTPFTGVPVPVSSARTRSTTSLPGMPVQAASTRRRPKTDPGIAPPPTVPHRDRAPSAPAPEPGTDLELAESVFEGTSMAVAEPFPTPSNAPFETPPAETPRRSRLGLIAAGAGVLLGAATLGAVLVNLATTDTTADAPVAAPTEAIDAGAIATWPALTSAPAPTLPVPVVEPPSVPASPPADAGVESPEDARVASPQTAGSPCEPALAAGRGEPLRKATRLAGGKPRLPTSSEFYDDAIAQARLAVDLAPRCAAAWSVLGLALYRRNYDVCGRGNYDEAQSAVERALELAGDDVAGRAGALRNLGRIAAARLDWSLAERRFTEVLELVPGNGEATIWLADLSTRKAPSPAVLAAVGKALRGERLVDADVAGLTFEEVSSFLAAAPVARHGRRLNAGATDWLYYCDDSPVRPRPTLDPDAARDPIAPGSVDAQNRKFLRTVEARLRPDATASTPD